LWPVPPRRKVDSCLLLTGDKLIQYAEDGWLSSDRVIDVPALTGCTDLEDVKHGLMDAFAPGLV
jgi:hypothetical protein